jgi:hypothetical protein
MCAHANVNMSRRTCKNSLEYCPFFKTICLLVFFGFTCVFSFQRIKSTLFSISVFSFCLCFLFKTRNHLSKCMISKCLLFLNLCFYTVISVEWSLCVQLPFFSIKYVSLCMDFCILQYINLYVKNIYTFPTFLVQTLFYTQYEAIV